MKKKYKPNMHVKYIRIYKMYAVYISWCEYVSLSKRKALKKCS